MRNLINVILLAFIIQSTITAQRVKDIAIIGEQNSEQIIGYGLVVGLAGSGDSHRSSFTIQSVTSMLKRFGITVPQAQLKTRNVAAVMVTATINAFLKPGSAFDVNVSSLGDAKSLQGGTLLMTPLSGINGNVYGFAQGPVSVGGYDVSTNTGSRVSRNHTLAGRVPRGGSLKSSPSDAIEYSSEIKIFLKNPDLTTSDNVAKVVNQNFGEGVAKAIDASEVQVNVPVQNQNNIVEFLAQLESLEVTTDFGARVVLNERTGTVVAGNNVIIKPVTISHGGLNINIKSYPIISQPGAFSGGRTEVFNNLVPEAFQDTSNVVAIDGASNVQEVAAALNSLKVSPQDIIAIFQAIKEAGALVGELIIL
ncbi:MAG: flagellar basal body P-ring protein FlgI [Melioribacteraceae bacterium]|nr:flagellar basal body P-ring protein FlgI [Melioribacteraceae bacterium]